MQGILQTKLIHMNVAYAVAFMMMRELVPYDELLSTSIQ